MRLSLITIGLLTTGYVSAMAIAAPGAAGSLSLRSIINDERVVLSKRYEGGSEDEDKVKRYEGGSEDEDKVKRYEGGSEDEDKVKRYEGGSEDED